MSFYVVPLILYQTKKKLDESKQKERQHLEGLGSSGKKKKKVKKRPKDDCGSLSSSGTDATSIALRKKHNSLSSSNTADAQSQSHSQAHSQAPGQLPTSTPQSGEPEPSPASDIAEKYRGSLPPDVVPPKIPIARAHPSFVSLNLSLSDAPSERNRTNSAYSTTSSSSLQKYTRNSSLSSNNSSQAPSLHKKGSSSSRFSRKLSSILLGNTSGSSLSASEKSAAPSILPMTGIFKASYTVGTEGTESTETNTETNTETEVTGTETGTETEATTETGTETEVTDTATEVETPEVNEENGVNGKNGKNGKENEVNGKVNEENGKVGVNVEVNDTGLNDTGVSFDINRTPSELIPEYIPITKREILNDTDSIKKVLLTPGFQIFKYNNFLEMLSDHTASDAVNFASVRHQSLQNFLNKYNSSRPLWRRFEKNFDSFDIRYCEGFMAHALLEIRDFLRKLLHKELTKGNSHGIFHNEELLQINFTNYVRYLLNLPEDIDPETLQGNDRVHYKYKTMLHKVADVLYAKLKEDVGAEAGNSTGKSESSTKAQLLIQLITKVSYEYLLLEKYAIHILAKFSDNSVIETRVLAHLFSMHLERVKTNNSEQVKVLLYNTSFSSQYSWFMALTAPFLRVIESSISSECYDATSGPETYAEFEAKTAKSSFEHSDLHLYENFTKKLLFEDYKQFKSTSPERLVRLHKLLDNTSPKYADLSKRLIPDPCAMFSFKPMNFEHYDKLLATFKSNSFELVHSRDLAVQLTPTNYLALFSQFYRILKPNGFLEIPYINLGSDSISQGMDKTMNGVAQPVNKLQHWLSKQFDNIPNVVLVILEGLKQVFGESHLRFSVAILNKDSDINKLLIKHMTITQYEMVGRIKEFFVESDEIGPITEEGRSNHYYMYIRAQKNKENKNKENTE